MDLLDLLFKNSGTITRKQFVVTFLLVFLVFAIAEYFVWRWFFIDFFGTESVSMDPIQFWLIFIWQIIAVVLYSFITKNLSAKRYRALWEPEEKLNWWSLAFRRPSLELIFEPTDMAGKKALFVLPLIALMVLGFICIKVFIIPKLLDLLDQHPAVLTAKEFLQKKEEPLFWTGIAFSTRSIQINESWDAGNAEIELAIMRDDGTILGYETIVLNKTWNGWSVTANRR